MGPFADMTNEEYREKIVQNGGLYEEVSENANVVEFDANVKLASSLNWSTKGYVTPVEN